MFLLTTDSRALKFVIGRVLHRSDPGISTEVVLSWLGEAYTATGLNRKKRLSHQTRTAVIYSWQ